MIICKIVLQLMVTAFKENLGFTVLLCLYLKLFISEQIAENRFGGLSEISDELITKLNV